jgi:cytochrome c oxidase cbb3-type subunit III
MRYAFLLLAPLVLSCAKKPLPVPAPKPTASVTSSALSAANLAALDGQALYGKYCAICHAKDGSGYMADNAPSLVTKSLLESATDDQLRKSIVEGRPGTAMAAYGNEFGGPLDRAAEDRIIAWLRSKTPAPPVALPHAPKGDAKHGEIVYSEYCGQCHGTPSARGVAVHLSNPKFLAAWPDAFLKWAIVNGRAPTTMPAWKDVLSDTQVNDVVTFVRSQDKNAPVTLLPAPTGSEPVVINPNGKPANFMLRADPCGADPKCKPDPRYVSVDQVKQALSDKRRLIILDARPPSEWMRVHIPGALSVPYHDLKRLAEIPNDGTPVIAYCACPHHLSGDVVDALRKKGNKTAMVLDEGILEWHRRGYPVVAAEGVEPPPKGPPQLLPQPALPEPAMPAAPSGSAGVPWKKHP